MKLRWKSSLLVKGGPIIIALVFGAMIGHKLNQHPIQHSSLTHEAITLASTKVDNHPANSAMMAHPDATEDGDSGAESEMVTDNHDTIFICPMNCIAPAKQAGQCPVCGMDLVAHPVTIHSTNEEPVRANEEMEHHGNMKKGIDKPISHDNGHNHHAGMPAGHGPAVVNLSSSVMHKAGIRVAPVEEKLVSAKIRLFGKIEYDPVDQYKVTAFTPGVVDNIYIRRAGQAVRRGDPLFDLRSAELYYLEQELLEILKELPYTFDLFPSKGHTGKRSGRYSKPLYPTAPGKDNHIDPKKSKEVMKAVKLIRRKMRLLGLSKKDIDLVIRRAQPTGIATITTPLTGIVLEQNAFRGAFVNTGDVIFTIANPRVLWARLDAYASDFPWVRLGQKASFETDAYPGVQFEGKVVNIDPEFDADRRVFKVGVLFQDSKGLLKPNMLVRSVIHAELKSGGQGATEMVTTGAMGTAQMKRSDNLPLVIPESAPLITGERAIVYVQDPDKFGVFRGQEVVLGPRAEGYYIVNSGLEKGEQVVVNGNFKIDSAVQIMARSSMMSHEGSAMPTKHYRQVKTPPLAEAEVESQNVTSPSGRRGSQHNIYKGYRDKVQ